MTQLESKISLVQERAYQDDDQTWMGGDEENYTIAEPDRAVTLFLISPKLFLIISFLQSQASSPDNTFIKTGEDYDFVDVESCAMPDGESPPSKRRMKSKKKEPATLEEGIINVIN